MIDIYVVSVVAESERWVLPYATEDRALESAKEYIQSEQYNHGVDDISIFHLTEFDRSADDILDVDDIDFWHQEYVEKMNGDNV